LAGLPKKDFDVTIDLGEPSTLGYIGINFFQHIAATSVMLSTQLTIAISEDGKEYKTVLDQSLETVKERDPIIKRIEIEFKK